MDKDIKDIYQTNDDIVFILNVGKKIGWEEIKSQSINRIIYLSKVLYAFVHVENSNIMNYYHFISTISGPSSSIIQRSIIDLESREFIIYRNSGLKLNVKANQLQNILESNYNPNKNIKQEWFTTIMLLLGKYGENKIFGFTVNDPLYIKSNQSNSPREIEFEINENKTLYVLNSFKSAFEDSIPDTRSISKKEYLELYFDYIFSQIIK